jgi:hypothetical protein
LVTPLLSARGSDSVPLPVLVNSEPLSELLSLNVPTPDLVSPVLAVFPPPAFWMMRFSPSGRSRTSSPVMTTW